MPNLTQDQLAWLEDFIARSDAVKEDQVAAITSKLRSLSPGHMSPEYRDISPVSTNSTPQHLLGHYAHMIEVQAAALEGAAKMVSSDPLNSARYVMESKPPVSAAAHS